MTTTSHYITPELRRYLHAVSLREKPVMRELREETGKLSDGDKQISPEQAQFMQLLVEIINAKKILELGTYTGYSSLALADVLPDDGKLITCDINEECTKIAKEYWKKANLGNKIEFHIRPAEELMSELIDKGEGESFDYIFIDADKAKYDTYYELSLKLLRSGGLLLIDNVLWFGKVADRNNNESITIVIRKLNQKIYNDKRVNLSLLPISDGLTVVRKF